MARRISQMGDNTSDDSDRKQAPKNIKVEKSTGTGRSKGWKIAGWAFGVAVCLALIIFIIFPLINWVEKKMVTDPLTNAGRVVQRTVLDTIFVPARSSTNSIYPPPLTKVSWDRMENVAYAVHWETLQGDSGTIEFPRNETVHKQIPSFHSIKFISEDSLPLHIQLWYSSTR